MTKKLIPGKESEFAVYMIEWRPRKSAKWRVWIWAFYPRSMALRALSGQRSQHHGRGYEFRIVRLTKTPMEETE